MGWLLHVLVDVALATGLVIGGLHGSGTDYLVLDATGAYLVAITLLTDALGGVVRLLSRFTHRVLDALVGAALVVSPLVLWRTGTHLDGFATSMAVAVGVILLRDAAVSEHRVLVAGLPMPGPGPRRSWRRGSGRSGAGNGPIDVTAHVIAPGQRPEPRPEPRDEAGTNSGPSASAGAAARRAGVVTGKAAATARRAGRFADSKGLNARNAGVVAGRAGRYGRAARSVLRKGSSQPPPDPK
jgi:hypothetical protein